MSIENLMVLAFSLSLFGTASCFVYWYLNDVVFSETDRVDLNTEYRLYASMLTRMPRKKIRW